MVGFHSTVALRAGTHWNLRPEEAEALAKSWIEVQKHFPIVEVDPKWIALANMGYVVAGVYGPRIAISIHASKANAARDITPRPAPEPQPAEGHKPTQAEIDPFEYDTHGHA